VGGNKNIMKTVAMTKLWKKNILRHFPRHHFIEIVIKITIKAFSEAFFLEIVMKITIKASFYTQLYGIWTYCDTLMQS
jgi:hypothetical protein